MIFIIGYLSSGLPRSLEAAIQRYGSATYKAPAGTVLDPNGKLFVTLTYGKLLSRSYKIAYTLLNRALTRTVGECCLKPGDRIALVYPNNDPISFMCAFYGCLQAGIVPVPIEVLLTRRDAGSQQIGFLLGSCGVQVALTSEACLKGLPKTTAGDVVAFKGWPKLHWFVTEHLGKIPKDWMPQPRLTDETPAYIEYSTDKDGSVMGVTVTRSAMLENCRSLTMACGYTEGENAVCVLDFKREVGLWHSTLTSILNGMHVIFIPYALMKVNPASWMQMITKHRASVAVVKSRDLHWGLLATKDHKDISLASLRLLLVADGANPWSLSSCDQFLSVFQPKGLRPDAVCPCASSSEALTVSVRRPGRAGVNATGRGVLSMSGLSYGVVRVDQENSLTSLTLQDCGQVMPGSVVVVVKMLLKPREIHSAGDSVSDVGPASVMVGNIVQGNRLASAQGRDLGVLDEDSDNAKKYQFISEILRWRAMSTSDHVIFTLLNAKGVVTTSLSCSQLHKKAEKIGNLLLDKGRINTGDHVALLFPPGTDLICAFYGCLYVGAVPVTIRPPHPQNLQTTLPTVRMIVDVSKSVLVLTNQNMVRLLKSKEANNVVEIKSWPTILDMDDMPKKKLPVMYRAPTAEMLAYLDFSVSTTGMLAGIKMSHAAVTSLCRAMKLACELYPSRHIALCLDPYSGLGLNFFSIRVLHRRIQTW
ncbi:disco-interacting protein 2-like isoform X1 [Aphidius gifuensis]|uniref:disco-interacting protein 2-like isoform X1 n=1 Tax=Aphidius gifuensis TaxID=684658 RepID=UPI001CDBA2F1|nr:disco-interacting protein 2-like isoform X1 [Aphidius gifuensis]XP_044015310.1 disco-interacting protein 2-like isoform X1 [Aphidius gifuensis]